MSGIEKRVSGLYFLNHMKFFSLLLYSLFGLWEYGGNEKEVKISFFFFFGVFLEMKNQLNEANTCTFLNTKKEKWH